MDELPPDRGVGLIDGHAPRGAGDVRPSVSVALATYNGERFVAEQLRSILGQDFSVTEVVVADDGSTDRTLAIIEEVAAAHQGPTEVRVVHTSRVGGVTQNFDRVLASCQGDILVLSDQDDLWEPTRISSILPLFPADGAAHLVFSDATLVDANGRVLPGSLHENLRLRRRERSLLKSGRAFEVLLRRNVVTGAVTAFSRELRDLATPFPESWIHDEWLAIVAAAVGEVVRVDDRLVRYRLHAANQIGVTDPGTTARLGRMMAPRADRLERLALRSGLLAKRLVALDAPERAVAAARAKARFEAARSAYPAARLARAPRVFRELARGTYSRLASQRSLDAVRDLLQPA